MDGGRSQRISQKSKRQETSDCSLLEQAEAFAQRVLESVQALAGTANCKGVLTVVIFQNVKQQKKKYMTNF